MVQLSSNHDRLGIIKLYIEDIFLCKIIIMKYEYDSNVIPLGLESAALFGKGGYMYKPFKIS